MIKVYLNGKVEELENKVSIGDILRNKNIRVEVVTVELNDTIVSRETYNSTYLADGDRIEFVYYMGGGEPTSSEESQITNAKFQINVAKTIGNTPIIKLNRIIENNSADVYTKVEFFNPGGSVKDRICLAMIDAAEKNGDLKPGGTIVEPTSGNTGIGLAMIGASRGYKVILTMPETMSLERIYILRAFGAEVVLTAGVEGMRGAIKKAEEIINKNNAFMPQQFDNPANPEIHRRVTATEILNTLGDEIDAFVVGVGTGGTITGVGEILKSKNPNIKIIAVEPANSPVLSGGQPGPHKIQGIGAGFVPKVLNRDIIDRIITVKDDDAFRVSRQIARDEGLFVGISSGAAMYAALTVATELGKGKTVVTMFPDTGERYFSMEQFFSA